MSINDRQINWAISKRIINIENMTTSIINIRVGTCLSLKLPAAKFIATMQKIIDKI